MTKSASPLRLAREERGLTVRQLHAATGISTGRLSMLEREMVQAHASERQLLATALDTTGTHLFPDAPLATRRGS